MLTEGFESQTDWKYNKTRRIQGVTMTTKNGAQIGKFFIESLLYKIRHEPDVTFSLTNSLHSVYQYDYKYARAPRAWVSNFVPFLIILMPMKGIGGFTGRGPPPFYLYFQNNNTILLWKSFYK